MKFPTVSHCCFCFDLRSAGLAVGALSILISLLSIGRGDAIIPNVLSLFISIFWIIGIRDERPDYMLPSVILSFAVLVLIILSPFLFILIVYTLPGSNITDNYINPSDLPLYFVGYFLIVIVSSYLWIVEYSTYRFIKEISIQHRDQPNEV